MRQIHLLVLLLCLVAGPLAADELRLNYVLGQADVTFDPDGPGDHDGEWDENTRWELGAYSNLGTIWGFGIGTQRAKVAADDWSLDYESWYARVYSGMAPVMTETFTWEIVGYTGLLLGEAELTQDDPLYKDASDRDVGYEFGAQSNLTVALTRMFFVGAGVGYGWTMLELDLDGGERVDQQGVHYFGYAGLRF